MFRIVQSFNNNAALVEDDQHAKWIVIGKGIGFGLKKGDVVNQQAIQNCYRAVDQEDFEVMRTIDPKVVKLTNEILTFISKQLHQEVTGNDYASLADHLAFALQRAKEKIDFDDTSTRWEVAQLYPKEFKLAQELLPRIEHAFQVRLPKSEAVFLTYHFVNTEDASSLQDTIYLTKLIQKLINIVQFRYKVQLDPKSFNYSRFVTHLRLFLIRHMKGTQEHVHPLDEAFVTLTRTKYQRAFEVAESMVHYLQSETQWQISDSEKVYLALHLMRLIQDKQQQ
ncbi:PRD domain-containing protein [Lactobacillus sp. CC-MHH1034]|uniref:PRD domain-containing protein n=1 Tax=Agrilactobacillus fermenti TaxID=2586909 RepID=UPI001E5C6FEA|nr:PRD domain-containing protein [Agrilactobacillus fermenti]MCD2256268.1 PRD domain-containing protein [Agrilactobacillus fermenti]